MNQIFQLKIELHHIQTKIWRRILVTSDTNFYQLHHILQIAFGWKNYHLFQFDVNKKIISSPDPDFDDHTTIPAHEIPLKKLLTLHQLFEYEYDFGDYWCHSITVENILPLSDQFTFPYCLEGQRNAPPEDCGGTDGYKNLIKVLKNKKSMERKDLIEWLGGEHAYDPEYFDLVITNKQLTKLEQYIRKYEKQV
jgi:hypothetical protein